MNRRLLRQERNLDALFITVEKIEDEELKAHLARYLCIRTSGYLEHVVKELTLQYAGECCPKPVVNFVKRKTKNLTNLSHDRLTHFLASFDKDWMEYYRLRISDKQKTSLNSIVANRNLIAHGHPDNLSYERIKEYYLDLKIIVQQLKQIIQ